MQNSGILVIFKNGFDVGNGNQDSPEIPVHWGYSD